jgi:hypothetical protein
LADNRRISFDEGQNGHVTVGENFLYGFKGAPYGSLHPDAQRCPAITMQRHRSLTLFAAEMSCV